MDSDYHKVLTRHLQKYWQGETITPKLEALLKAINRSFDNYDRDHVLLERAMDLSSTELTEAYNRIKKELEQRRAANEKVLQSEHLLHSITTNLREAVFRRTIRGELIFVNQSFLELFGYNSFEELLSMPRENFYHDPKVLRKLLNDLNSKGSYNGKEILFKKKDGSKFWGLASSTVTSDAHGVRFIDGAIVDITAQKETEEELRRMNIDLQKTNAELDRFVYSASHDLRAPLMSLLGLINIIEIEKKKDNKEQLDLMRRSIVRLDHFIKDIIDYSYNARKEITLEKINFKEIIEESFEQFDYLTNSIEIERIVEVDENDSFFSDAQRLRVIFNNLISNALRYHNPRQPNPYVKILVNVASTSTLIEVCDNGVGIAPEHQEKVFQMFYRATATNTGSGLGLYIVKEAIDKLGGTIQLKSDFGEGTSFVVRIPNQANRILNKAGSR